jgi:hypothetical protein
MFSPKSMSNLGRLTVYNSFSLKGHLCETFIVAKYSVINNVQRYIVHYLNLLMQFSEGVFWFRF